MNTSIHAEIRSRQRGIPQDVIDLITEFGTREKRPGRAWECRLRKRDRERAAKHLKHLLQTLDRACKKAVLLSGDEQEIITVYSVDL
jgi:hypothetical protein